MAKVKVRVLYPTAFLAFGIEAVADQKLDVEKADADALVANGHAEVIQTKAVAKK